MAEEGAKQESFFWDTYPWVMSGKSDGSEEKPADGNSLVDSSIGDHNHIQMKQPVMGTIGGGSKGNDGNVVPKNDDAMKVSPHNDKGKKETEASENDLHIWTERERRKKMRNMFHQLHALLPQLPPKADKSAIVEEAATYIKNLQQTLQKLQTKKLERLHGLSTNTVQTERISHITRESFLADQVSSTNHFGIVSPDPSLTTSFPLSICSPTVFQTWTSSNVTLNVCGLDAHFSICSMTKPGLLTAICFVLEKHKLEIISAQIYSDQYKSLFMIHAQANVGDQFVETFPYDEVYKKAATEITLWA